MNLKNEKMKNTKNDVLDAILELADSVKLREGYEALMESRTIELPELVKKVVYDLFLNNFSSYHCSDELYASHKIIFEYADELRENGSVEFEK